jgi:hypothetical protein
MYTKRCMSYVRAPRTASKWMSVISHATSGNHQSKMAGKLLSLIAAWTSLSLISRETLCQDADGLADHGIAPQLQFQHPDNRMAASSAHDDVDRHCPTDGYVRIDDKMNNFDSVIAFKDNAVHDTLHGEGKIEAYRIYKRLDADEIMAVIKLGGSINGMILL